MVYKKKEKGIELTEEENKILKMERVRKSETEKEEITDEKDKNDKNKKQKKSRNNKKENTKIISNKETKDNETAPVMYTKINKLPIIHSRYLLESNQFKMNHILRDNKKVDNYHALYISNYMSYINQKRVIRYEGLQKNISILNQEFLEKYNQKILNDFENSQKIIKKDNYFVKSKEDENDIDDKKFSKFLNKFGNVRLKASDSMKHLMSKRNILNKGIIDKIAIEKKINDIFEFFKNKESNLNTQEKNEIKKNEKNAKIDHGKNEIDINEMTNVLEKAKELLPSDDKRLEELKHLIETKKEEIANKAAAAAEKKGKGKKK